MWRQSATLRAPLAEPGVVADFAAAVVAGLSLPQKSIPARFFYDAKGSALFEEITRLPEYYPTRTELAILSAHASEIVDGDAENAALIEFGSGSSRKTELLLERLTGLSSYVPIDVSADALEDARRRLAARFPSLEVYPLVRNFENLYPLPASISTAKKIGFFPGSTIGNFAPPDAISLLRAMLTALSKDSRLIVGVDLKKDVRALLRAYDDARGITAAFNLNLLERMNRELGATFALDAFRHKALYNAVDGRIEMHLVSLREQEVHVQGGRFQFRPGETIHTENSYKFTVAGFQDLARRAGWTPGRVWLDADALFSVHELAAP